MQLNIDRSLLHFDPLCAHISRSVFFAATTINQSSSTDQWHGHVVRAIAKSVLALGGFLNFSIAMIETVAFLSLSAVATALHMVTGAPSEFSQKYTLRLIGHTINSGAILLIQSVMILSLFTIPFKGGKTYHTIDALIHNVCYLGAALGAQVIGYYFDRRAGRNRPFNQPPVENRIMYIVRISLEKISRDFLRYMNRDFESIRAFGVFLQNNTYVQHFLEQNSWYRSIVNPGRINQIFAGDLQQNLFDLVIEIASHYAIAQPSVNSEEVILTTNVQADNDYQDYLQNIIKDAVLEFYHSSELTSSLSENQDLSIAENEGKEAILDCDPHIYLPIANYVQFKELESEICCPESFGNNNLHQYNSRLAELTRVKAEIQILSLREKNTLRKKLVCLGSYDFAAPELNLEIEKQQCLQMLFNDIAALSVNLHSGRLLSQTVVLVDNERMQDNQEVMYQNLFHKAYQKALTEIEQQPIAVEPI